MINNSVTTLNSIIIHSIVLANADSAEANAN